MATVSELQAKITKLPTNLDRLDGIVNGPAAGDDSIVEVDGGVEVKTLARIAAEGEVQVDDAAGYAAAAAASAAEAAGTVSAAADYAALLDDQVFDYIPGKNLYNPADNRANLSLNTSGNITASSGRTVSGFIPITAGATYTLSCSGARASRCAFYSDDLDSGAVVSYNGTNTNPLTLTAPVGSAFFAFQVVDATVTSEPAQLQFEEASAPTAYEAWHVPYPEVRLEALPQEVQDAAQTPDYEEDVTSPNLFNVATAIDGTFLNNSGVVSVSAGYGSSAPIPVTAGQTYTISGTRGRQGVGFYTSAVATTVISGSYNGSTEMPLTVTAPVGATHMRINLKQPTNTVYSNVQVEVGASETAYQAYGSAKKLTKASITPLLQDVVRPSLRAVLSTSTALGSSAWFFPLGSKTVRLGFSPAIALTHTAAQVFQLQSTRVDGVAMSLNQTDDIAPYRVGGWTIGAGHGYPVTVCTKTAHGKTAADLYSEWQDGSANRWIIVLIPDANTFWVTAKTGYGAFAGGALTHVTGATNTASVTPTAVAAGSYYPATANRDFRMEIDGVSTALSDATAYPLRDVTFLEAYEILNKDSLVAYLIANRAGADIPQPGGTSDIAVSNSFRFDDQGIVQTSDFLALQAVASFTDIMFIQAYKWPEDLGNGTLKYYIPNALAFTQDAVAYDFANGQDMTSFAPVNPLYITPARSEAGPALLPDRVLQVNDKIGVAIGILPVQDADPAVRRTNASRKALEIRNDTKKIYLSTIDRADKTSLTAGDYYSAVTYRRFFDPAEPRWFYTVPYGTSEYVYIHWQDTAATDAVPMPSRLVGRPFTVIDAHNATLSAGVVGAMLRPVVSASGDNAHLVLLVG